MRVGVSAATWSGGFSGSCVSRAGATASAMRFSAERVICSPKPLKRMDRLMAWGFNWLTYPVSDMARIRRKIHRKMGLTGKGITVRFLDTEWKHMRDVKTLVNHPWYGVSPGIRAQLQVNPAEDEDVRIKLPFSRADLFEDSLNSTCDDLKAILQEKRTGKAPELRIINMSMGYSAIDRYDELQKKLQNGDVKALKALYGRNGKAVYRSKTPEALCQDIVAFVNHGLKTRPAYRKAQYRYRQVAQRLAENGITMVASAGNEHDSKWRQYTKQPGVEFSELGMSPYVITVAASNSWLTPRPGQSNGIAPFSSWGDHQYQPTVAAPGNRVLFFRDGTSFAVPMVVGYIALMLEKNPDLSFQAIRTLLQRAAVKTAVSRQAQGAGVVDPVKLLELTPARGEP